MINLTSHLWSEGKYKETGGDNVILTEFIKMYLTFWCGLSSILKTKLVVCIKSFKFFLYIKGYKNEKGNKKEKDL